MSYAAISEVCSTELPVGAATSAFPRNANSFPHSSQEKSYGETNVFHNGSYSRKVRGDRNRNRISTSDLSDWLRDQTSHLTAKELAIEAGCGVRAAENVKQGRNNFTSAHMSTLFLNCPEIGARYVEFIGQILPGQAELAEAYTRFANAVVRKP